ncbi:hypothetical protein L1987_19291 [Smallanthus sonchifolius]|uniref:Uncharacterized protein n=1 Tax=Smallanthus sonchifolius TaxID=185202 RepID=A0ACB9IN82_9ASTR|nr:hypothetical protein L1987_19291 [Smallanthus sonchifolius]
MIMPRKKIHKLEQKPGTGSGILAGNGNRENNWKLNMKGIPSPPCLGFVIMVLFACSYWWFPSCSNLTSEKQKPQGGYDDGVSISPPAVGNSCPYPCTPQPPPLPRRGSAIYAAPPPPPAATSCPPVAPTHGVLNAVSWGVLMPMGAMVDPAWFYIHVDCQIIAYGVGVAG